MFRTPWITFLVFAIFTANTPSWGQNSDGDQFLDGIGETALIARYPFEGNVKDASRNQHHGTLRGERAAFVAAPPFANVLSLPGGVDGAYVTLPGQALIGVESLSVTGWIRLETLLPWQRFFDLGQDTQRYFFCTPVGAQRDGGCRVRITSAGHPQEQGPASFRVPTDRWVHLATVLDTVRKTLSLYVDGVRVGQSTGISLTLEEILDQDNPAANRLYIGKSQFRQDESLTGKVHDFRFYRIALSDQQVATIHRNALSGSGIVAAENVAAENVVAPESETDEPNQQSSEMTPRLLVNRLQGVSEVAVQTKIGHLPQLPRYVKGNVKGNDSDQDRDGPLVAVIWPAATDNQDVLQAGTYTVTGTVPGTQFSPKATITVVPELTPDTTGAGKAGTDRIGQLRAEPFPLGQVVLNSFPDGRETPYIQNRDKFIAGLARTDPDTFLYNFRDAFGQKQPQGAVPLQGWDSQTTRLRGHTTGHYLTALAQVYGGASDNQNLQAEFAAKMNNMIDVLYELSQKSGKPTVPGGPCNADPAAVPPASNKSGFDSDLSTEGIRTDYWNWGEGYISGYPPDQFIMLEQGASYGGSNQQVWAPYYTLHKILAGLMDCYEVGGNPKALATAEAMGRWVYLRLKAVPEETRIQMWNRYIAGEYGGMNEAMARLSRLTENEDYLRCAQLFDNVDFFFGNAQRNHGLAKNVDTIRSKHANQHIPQITGALETYRASGDRAYYLVAENFWRLCTNGYMYSIGGVAGAKNPNNAECFTAQPDTLFRNGFSSGGQNETCATYNLLKLSRQLFLFNQTAKYMDYYEQALINHILASVDQDNSGNTYHVPLNPGARKSFGNARMNSFTCCNATALESSTKLQDSIYFKSIDNETLYVNLFVPSKLNWTEKKLTVTQQTLIPYSDTTTLTIGGSGTLEIQVRIPSWATRDVAVGINGIDQNVQATAGHYLSLRRDWKEGDTITLKLPMSFHLSPLVDQPQIASVFYGPVLMAVQEIEPRSSWRKLTLDAKDLNRSFTGDASTLRFRCGDAELKPFFETYGRHSVYLDLTLQ